MTELRSLVADWLRPIAEWTTRLEPCALLQDARLRLKITCYTVLVIFPSSAAKALFVISCPLSAERISNPTLFFSMDLIAQCVPDVQARGEFLTPHPTQYFVLISFYLSPHTVGLYWLRFGAQTCQSALEKTSRELWEDGISSRSEIGLLRSNIFYAILVCLL